MKKTQWIFICIIILASVLRFFHLGINPPSLTWDEASWGYNAYSLGFDGHDEFGRIVPVDYLESFGDFKPPVYAYLAILPIKIFGLTEFATRFPSAAVGVCTVIVTFFLTEEIFYAAKNKKLYALIASCILSISPWHFMLSRAAFEANVATFFLVCGVWLFLISIHGKKWFLPISIASFVLSMYTFNTSRVVAPLLVIMLFFLYIKKIYTIKKQAMIAFFVGILLILPTIRFLLSPQAALRFKEVNIFSDIGIVEKTNQEIVNDHNIFWSKIIHNRRFAYSLEFLHHYFDNLNPAFLFISGDGNPKFSTQDTGELYLWDLPFFIIGILLLFKKKEGEWFLIPLWILLGIIPAATARETPHALRIETIIPMFQLLIAYGFSQTILYLYGKKKNNIFYILFGLLLLVNVSYFLHGYVYHYTNEYSGEWQYGYKESIAYVQSVINNFDEVRITDDLGRPYIYYLFYTKTNPQVFRETAVISRDTFGFVTIKSFGKYVFEKNLTLSQKKGGKILFVDRTERVPQNANIMKTFYLLNGTPILTAYTL